MPGPLWEQEKRHGPRTLTWDVREGRGENQMKVLMGAYACVPMWGSEPGAGWYWAEAAAVRHDVWVLTAEENREPIEACLDAFPQLRQHLHPVYIGHPRWLGRSQGGNKMHLARYLIWQHTARRAARRLDAEIHFDVAHHVSWTVSWLPAAVAGVTRVPLVWGPVSGAVAVPRAMWRWLGWKGAVRELVRMPTLPVLRAVFARRPLARAAVVLTQSEEFAMWARRRTAAPVVVEPVVALRGQDFARYAAPRPALGKRDRVAVFAARFAAWKGLLPTIAALARPEASGWKLDVYGEGRGEKKARSLAAALGLEDRVRFHGHVFRADLDRAIAVADAFVHPSFHDAPPFVVAEALALGCPVVCLDVGGPAALVGDGEGVRVTPTADLPHGLARALQSIPSGIEPSTRWDWERLPDRFDAWYAVATGTAPPSSLVADPDAPVPCQLGVASP